MFRVALDVRDLELVNVVLAEAWPQIMTDDEWLVILSTFLGDLFLNPNDIGWLSATDRGCFAHFCHSLSSTAQDPPGLLPVCSDNLPCGP